MYLCLLSRRRTTLINLRLAFPALPEAEYRILARRAFRHLGMAAGETAWLWYRPVKHASPVSFVGEEHLTQALAAGKGVILLQAHFTVLELCAALIGNRWPVRAVYDIPKNPLFAAQLHHQRARFLTGLIDNRDIRTMVRCLKGGEMVWYSPDQSVARSHGGAATRYFGQPVLSTTGTARISKLTGAAIIPFIPARNEDGSHYTLTFHPPLHLDGDDPIADTQRVNDMLESQVRGLPEQYLWAHKRFKPPSRVHVNPYS
jgi:KDO2-lipid IV(A) lauroyltransferase